jgi:predicted ribosome quality control (RQC) complex YloA/Tae2 family protein
LKAINQKAIERIILVEFDSNKHGDLLLVVELFKPSNMVLCKSQNGKLTILQPLEKQLYKDRSVEAKKEYLFPPEQNDVTSMTKDQIARRLSESDKMPVKFVAADLGFGGIYAEELFCRAGVNKNLKKDEFTENQYEKVASAVKDILDEEISASESGGKIFPVEMKTVTGSANKYSSFSGAIDANVNFEVAKTQIKIIHEKKENKQQVIIDAQLKRIRQLEKEAEENQKIGEYLYEHYQEFSKLLSTIRDLRSRKKSWPEIGALLKKNRHFKELDEKEKTLTLEF